MRARVPAGPRRQFLRQGLAAALAPPAVLAGCAAGPWGHAPQEGAATAAAVCRDVGEAICLAPGAYMFAGKPGLADEDNGGRIGNAGFLIGPQGVVSIDCGTSLAHGQALWQATAAAAGGQTVRELLVTHTRPEFLFGAEAYRQKGVPLAMHSLAARLMVARCDTCLKNLKRDVGEEPLRGTVVPRADRTFEDRHAHTATGRGVQVLYFGHSSGPGDIAVWDATSGVLFAGGMADNGRIPDVQDGQLAQWHKALDALQALAPRRVVPGHGRAGGPEVIVLTRRYLQQLETKVRALIAEGATLMTAPELAELPEFAAWDQYDLIHRRNVSILYLRIEREQFMR